MKTKKSYYFLFSATSALDSDFECFRKLKEAKAKADAIRKECRYATITIIRGYEVSYPFPKKEKP